MSNKIIFNQYIQYGLNHKRSFLRLPKGNNDRKIYLPTEEDITEFSSEALRGHDCECCALFYVFKDGTYGAYFKTIKDAEVVSDDSLKFTYSINSARKKDTHLFAELDGDFRFCCYSLLLEIDDGLFEVCV